MDAQLSIGICEIRSPNTSSHKPYLLIEKKWTGGMSRILSIAACTRKKKRLKVIFKERPHWNLEEEKKTNKGI